MTFGYELLMYTITNQWYISNSST